MKKIFTYKQLCLFAMLAAFTFSCKREELSEVVKSQEGAKVSLTLPAKIEVAGGTNYTLNNDELIVPVTIDFDGPSTRAFAVQLTANLDTIATLIANQALPASTVPMQEGMFSIPSSLNIEYGVNSVSFNIAVNRTFLEKNYGKDIAFAAKMSSIAKGNISIAGKTSTVIVIKTGMAIDPNAVHYVMFGNTLTGVLNFPKDPLNPGWVQGSQDLVIPLNLILTGQAGGTFTVDLTKSTALVNAAIANGTLVNTKPLNTAAYNFDAPKLPFNSGKNSVQTNINIRSNEIIFAPGNTKLAVGITLNNPTKWQLGGTNTSVILVIDPAYFKRASFNVTPFLIKNTVAVESQFIPASNYDLGGEGVGYHDDTNRDGGQFRRPDPVDVGDNNITVGWTSSGEWLTYTVDVEEDGVYDLNAIIGGQDDGRSYSVYSGAQNISGGGTLPVIKTPGGYGDQQPNYSSVSLKKGPQVIKFQMDNANYDFKGLIFTKANQWDGSYSISGTVVRNRSAADGGPDTNLGGTFTSGPIRKLRTIGVNQLSFVPVWRNGDNVGAVDNTSITIDPATNAVTVASAGNATLHNTAGKDNKYDPATKTLTLNFEWGTGDNTRSASYTLKYAGLR
jgi:hypothetical protein